MFLPGRGLTSIMLLILIALVLFAIRKASQGKVPKIRSFPAIEAIPEAIGRAAEMGKPIHMSSGFAGLHDASAPMTIAGLAILSHVAEEAARRGVPMRYTVALSHLVPVVEELMKSACARAGRPEMYNPDTIYYVGETQNAFMAAAMGFIYRERPAASFLFGATFYETVTVLGSAAVVGAFQIAGTPRVFYQPYLITTCDYTLLLDELYAAAAALTKKPQDLGSIAGLDYSKFLSLIFIALGTILSTAGLAWWNALLRW